MTLTEKITHIHNTLSKNTSKLSSVEYNTPGLTSQTTQNFLNNIADIDNINILEIGSWCGATTSALLKDNNITLSVVDTWAGVEETPIDDNLIPKINKEPIDIFKDTISRYPNKISIHQADIFSKQILDRLLEESFDIIFYDASHEVEDIIKFIILYYKILKDKILIVDDYNFESVSEGLRIAFKHIKPIQFEYAIKTEKESKDTWWNGIYITIL